jgi:hypothetical protein
MCDEKKGDEKMPAALKVRSQSQSLLRARKIAQDQMKKKGIKYDDVLKIIKEYKNDK